MQNRSPTLFSAPLPKGIRQYSKETMIYPVITLHQPWATWIARGWKTIESRTHNRFKSLVGQTVLIHAGLYTDSSAIHNPYLTKDQLLRDPDEMINGYIICSAYVYESRILSVADEPFALIECRDTKRYGLFLKDIEMITKPIAISGGLGIWYFDMITKQKVTKP